MDEIHYSPGDIIYSNSEGGKTENCLMYIYKGKILCKTEKNRFSLKKKKVKKVFC